MEDVARVLAADLVHNASFAKAFSIRLPKVPVQSVTVPVSATSVFTTMKKTVLPASSAPGIGKARAATVVKLDFTLPAGTHWESAFLAIAMSRER